MEHEILSLLQAGTDAKEISKTLQVPIPFIEMLQKTENSKIA